MLLTAYTKFEALLVDQIEAVTDSATRSTLMGWFKDAQREAQTKGDEAYRELELRMQPALAWD